MKKTLLTLSMMAASWAATAQGNDITIPFINMDLRPGCDSTVTEVPESNNWKFKEAYVFKLNAANGFVESLLMYDTNKVNTFRINFTYASGKASQATTNVNMGGNMLAFSNTYFTYDANNRVIRETMITNVPVTDTSEMYEYTYDGAGKMTQHIRSKKESGVMELTDKETFTYNGAGLCDKASRYFYDNGNWTLQRELSMTYNTAGKEIERIEKLFPANQNHEKTEHVYDASNNDILELRYSWNNNAWEHISTDTNLFTGSLRTESRKYEKKNGNWVYDERERCAEGNAPTAVRKILAQLNGTVYPNPAKNEVHVLHLGLSVSIQVMNINGQVLELPQITTPTQTTLDTRSLVPGIYLLSISNGHDIKTQKIVIQ